MTLWFRLDALTGCRIDGPDAVAFCQSQFTADIEKLTPDIWQPLAWCSRKGRVRLLSLAKRDQDRVELIFPRSQAGLLDDLKRFTIGRKADIALLQGVDGTQESDQGTRIAGDQSRRALRLCDDQASAAPSAEPEWLDRWALQDVLMPLPWLNDRTQDRFLPQALGLESNAGLSYTKGCYPGQEIVARVHYLGRPPERLARLSTTAPDECALKALLATEDLAVDGNRITLLATARDAGQWLALAVVPDRTATCESFVLEVEGTRITAEMTLTDSL